MRAKKWLVQIYLFLMLGIFPLYYQNKYFNMGDAKYEFFKYVTVGMLILLALFCLLETMISVFKKEKIKLHKPNLSAQDIAVLSYTMLALLSWFISPFRESTWIGSPEWYMGLLSQLLFVGIYFAVSRFSPDNLHCLWFLGTGAAIAFLVAYLHRFKIDPLGFYEGVAEHLQLKFLGTVGQATWYSSYLCVILPIFLGIYMVGLKSTTIYTKICRFFVAVLIFLGFASAVTQNSDSAYIGLGLAILVLLWFALEDYCYWKRFMELLIIALISIKCTGILQLKYPERVPALEPISLSITKGSLTWILLIITIAAYLLTFALRHLLLQRTQDTPKFKQIILKVRILLYILFAIAVLSLPVLMWLATTGKLPADWSILGESGYLVFDETWGNWRGKNWIYTWKTFQEFPLSMKLFGCGPDGMSFYYTAYHQEEIQAMWGGLLITNAHNEWMTAVFDYGILGGLSYLSIFIVPIFTLFKNGKKNPLLIITGASILSYMGHNFFCYQQSVCTSLVFIILGAAEFYRKKIASTP